HGRSKSRGFGPRARVPRAGERRPSAFLPLLVFVPRVAGPRLHRGAGGGDSVSEGEAFVLPGPHDRAPALRPRLVRVAGGAIPDLHLRSVRRVPARDVEALRSVDAE